MSVLKLTFAIQQRIAHRSRDGCTIGSLLPEASCEEMSSDLAVTPQKYHDPETRERVAKTLWKRLVTKRSSLGQMVSICLFV
jgi:hypothetical protein